MMAFGHGLPKMEGFAQRKDSFPEFFGLDSSVTLSLAIFAEVFCSFLLAVGLLTRAALILLIVTMLVAVLVVHGDDPFSKQEVGLLYLIPYVVIYLTGPGKYSLDKALLKK
jgi:putative oxidoreductase